MSAQRQSVKRNQRTNSVFGWGRSCRDEYLEVLKGSFVNFCPSDTIAQYPKTDIYIYCQQSLSEQDVLCPSNREAKSKRWGLGWWMSSHRPEITAYFKVHTWAFPDLNCHALILECGLTLSHNMHKWFMYHTKRKQRCKTVPKKCKTDTRLQPKPFSLLLTASFRRLWQREPQYVRDICHPCEIIWVSGHSMHRHEQYDWFLTSILCSTNNILITDWSTDSLCIFNSIN